MSTFIVLLIVGTAGALSTRRAVFWARQVRWQRLFKVERCTVTKSVPGPWMPRPAVSQVDCAWCGETLRAGCQPVSHGICGDCRAALIDGGAPEPDRVQHN